MPENKSPELNKPKESDISIDKVLRDSLKNVNNLVDLQSVSNNIIVDLKYAGTDNFMKTRLYDTLNKAFLQKDVALRLAKVQEKLTELKPGYKLVVYDALRPRSVQKQMWDALDSIPVLQRSKFVSNPKNGSVHMYGAAVDLSILDENGKLLDMGAGYDDIRKIAYPSMETYFLQTGELTEKQVANRKLLRQVMRSQQFRNIPTEWWHFNAYSRATCQSRYKAVEHEF